MCCFRRLGGSFSLSDLWIEVSFDQSKLVALPEKARYLLKDQVGKVQEFGRIRYRLSDLQMRELFGHLIKSNFLQQLKQQEDHR